MIKEELQVQIEEKEYQIFHVRGNKFYHFMKRLEDICAMSLS